ncbi:hypothetical protein BG004_005574 [Podila humilis]|nr:hypothetical protein BG004_005574 [Podila humilis]
MARSDRDLFEGENENHSPITTSSSKQNTYPIVPSLAPQPYTTRRPSIIQRIMTNPSSLRATSHRSSHVKSLRFLWCLALLSGEHIIYWVLIYRCSWPENSHWSAERVQDRYRIAIVADPQLTDWYSYKQSGLLLFLVETYTDLFMRRSFSYLHRGLRPDAVLFLGDLNDGGRDTANGPIWDKNEKRFMDRIFQSKRTAWNQGPVVVDPAVTLVHNKRKIPLVQDTDGNTHSAQTAPSAMDREHYVLTSEIPSDSEERAELRRRGRSIRLYAAGNHDVGYGNDLIYTSMMRFKETFGATNYDIQMGNHSLIVLDTLSLGADDLTIRAEAQRFLDRKGEERETNKMIVEGGQFQYQNMVNATLSKEILSKIRPDMVFSGDDHDWCEIGHTFTSRSQSHSETQESLESSGGDGHKSLVPELTVPTFSFAQGIQQPAFVLLSLYNPNSIPSNDFNAVPTLNEGLPAATLGDSPYGYLTRPPGESTFEYQECMLPNQLRIYFMYIGLLIFTLGWIGATRYSWMVRGDFIMASGFQPLSATESLDDEEDEEKQAGMRTSPSPRPSAAIEIRVTNELEPPPTEMMLQRSHDSRGSRTMRRYLRSKSFSSACQESSFADSLESPVLGLSPSSSSTSPFRSSLFWKMVGWDVGYIVVVVIPMYVLLFACSMF